jgi:hypothetical protein
MQIKNEKVLYMKNSWPNFIFIDLGGNEYIIQISLYKIEIHRSS